MAQCHLQKPTDTLLLLLLKVLQSLRLLSVFAYAVSYFFPLGKIGVGEK